MRASDRLRVHNVGGWHFYVADLDRRNPLGTPIPLSVMYLEHGQAERALHIIARALDAQAKHDNRMQRRSVP